MFSVNRFHLLAIAAALLALPGCGGGKIPPTRYYTLNLAAPAPAPERLSFSGVVMPFRASGTVDRGRIVYRESREEVGFYEYHKWAENPRTEIAEALIRQLLARGSFASLTLFDGRTKGDYILRGNIERLEEVDYDPPVSAAVEISLQLIDGKSAKVVWSGSASRTGPVTGGDVRSVVSGLSQAAERSIDELAGKLDSFLRAGG